LAVFSGATVGGKENTSRVNLSFENQVPVKLCSSDFSIPWANSPYRYCVIYKQGEEKVTEEQVSNLSLSRTTDGSGRNHICIEGRLGSVIGFRQEFVQPAQGEWLEEVVTLKNLSEQELKIVDIKFGFRRALDGLEGWRLIAVPFRVTVDTQVHDYSVKDLMAGAYSNSDQKEHCWTKQKVWPDTMDKDRLRSEAWLWTNGERGVLIGKYNNDHIEMSVAQVEGGTEKTTQSLRFGGVGLCLYNEPRPATRLAAGESFSFGVTRYEPYTGVIADGYDCYKKWLDSKGHGFPADYNAPLTWEVLYDVGWHHSVQENLQKYYNLETLRGEARKAKEVGAELLYLDPGWETCEGVNVWDEKRLGKAKDFVKEMKEKFGLEVGFRTVGHVYRDEFPHKWYCQPEADKDERGKSGLTTGKRVYWRTCACCEDWRKDHVRKMTDVAESGMKFMMHDENSWFGPCYATDHGHTEPTTPEDHVKALYSAIRQMRKSCPEIVVEAHDPVWSWFMRYLPVYFQQGFGLEAGYQENWGFEMMWDCIQGLLNGSGRVFYYYAMGTDIPVYLHTSMITDNDNLLFFWWVASTVRHLGIGGKYHNFQPSMREKYCQDVEKRWAEYKKQMKLYKSLKPYFVRGEFYGLGEEAHLHTLKERSGAVLNLYNLSKTAKQKEVLVPAEKLKVKAGTTVELYGEAELKWSGDNLVVSTTMEALAPKVLVLGDAVKFMQGK